MRLFFASMCVAGAACAVDAGSHADESHMIASPDCQPPGCPPPANVIEHPTKRHLRVHELTEEERVISANVEAIASAVKNNLPLQVKERSNAEALPVELIESGLKSSTQRMDEGLESKSTSPYDLFEELGLQKVVEHVVNHQLKAINELMASANIGRLKAYLFENYLNPEDMLQQIYWKACKGNTHDFIWLNKMLDYWAESNDMKWLLDKKKPDEVLKPMGYTGSTSLLDWKQISRWTKYVDAFHELHNADRGDLLSYTGRSDLNLLKEVVLKKTPLKGSPRHWMLYQLFEYWRDTKRFSPSDFYTHLSFKTNEDPMFESRYSNIWIKYVEFLKMNPAKEFGYIRTREKMVNVLQGEFHEGNRKKHGPSVIKQVEETSKDLNPRKRSREE